MKRYQRHQQPNQRRLERKRDLVKGPISASLNGDCGKTRMGDEATRLGDQTSRLGG